MAHMVRKRNVSGEMWIQFAKREGPVFFNGRKPRMKTEFTRIGSDGRESVLDYIIGPEKVWKGGGRETADRGSGRE